LLGNSYTDPGAIASDKDDGDLTDSIQVTGDINSQHPGKYELQYNLEDYSGTRAKPVIRDVYVIDDPETSKTDTDNDGVTDSIEFIAGTDPYAENGNASDTPKKGSYYVYDAAGRIRMIVRIE